MHMSVLRGRSDDAYFEALAGFELNRERSFISVSAFHRRGRGNAGARIDTASKRSWRARELVDQVETAVVLQHLRDRWEDLAEQRLCALGRDVEIGNGG